MNVARAGAAGNKLASTRPARRERDGGHRDGRQARRHPRQRRPRNEARRQVGRLHPRRRAPQELHAPDRAAQIQEVLGLTSAATTYFLQVTDRAPRHGGLFRPATPRRGRLVGQGRPDRLPDARRLLRRFDHRACHHHRLRARAPRAAELKRLHDRRAELMDLLRAEYDRSKRR